MKKFLAVALLFILAPLGASAFFFAPGGSSGGGSTDASDLSSGTLPAARIGDNSVTSTKLLDNTVASGKIADGTIVNADISASAAIDATKIDLSAYATLVSPSFTTPTLGAASATTLDTGQGANELYDMDQNVQTTDNVTFNKVTATEGVVIGQSADTPGYVRLYEDSDNGTNYVEHIAEADLASSPQVTWGETQVALGALNVVTTGTIQGGIKINSDADGMTNAEMTAVGLYGTAFIATGAGTWTLDTAVAGMSACLIDSGTAHDLILDVQAGDDIQLKGTEQADGVGITNAAGSTTGDFVCVLAISNGHWITLGMGGTWASQ